MKKLTKRLIALTVTIAMLTIPTFALASSATQTPVTPVNEIERMADEYVRQLKVHNMRLMLDKTLTTEKRQAIEIEIDNIYDNLGKIGFKKATWQEVEKIVNTKAMRNGNSQVFDDLLSNNENFIVGGPYASPVTGQTLYYAMVYVIPTSDNSPLVTDGIELLVLETPNRTIGDYMETLLSIYAQKAISFIPSLYVQLAPFELFFEDWSDHALTYTVSEYNINLSMHSTAKYVYVADSSEYFQQRSELTHISNELSTIEAHIVRFFADYGPDMEDPVRVEQSIASPEYNNAIFCAKQNYLTGNFTFDAIDGFRYEFEGEYIDTITVDPPLYDPYYYS